MISATEGHDLFKIYINKFIRQKDFNNKMMNLLKCQYVKKTTARYFIFNIAGMNALFKDLYKNDINIIFSLTFKYIIYIIKYYLCEKHFRATEEGRELNNHKIFVTSSMNGL